jgi:hypothetical protein
MNLIEYIELIGDEKAAKIWGVEERTVQSWRLKERTPRPEHAKKIVDTSPVTYEGIYSIRQ